MTLSLYLQTMSIVLLLCQYRCAEEIFKLGENGHQYTLKIFDDFVTIECEKNTIHLEELPRSVVSELSLMLIKNCELPKESIQDIIEVLGANHTTEIKLDDVSLIKREHFMRGSVEEIYIRKSEVASDVFQDQSPMKRITLFKCNINFTETSFAGLTDLEFLNVGECHISDIPHGMFKSTPQLQKLRLSKSLITEIKRSTFEGLGNLEVLDLNENLLTSLSEDFLHFLPSLKQLYLDTNSLRELITNALKGSNLVEVNIKDNTIPLQLASRALAGMTQLKYVGLINCSLTTLPADLFEGSNALEAINLANNLIQDIPKNFFEGKISLSKLNLNNNHLSVLSPDTFAHLPNLKILQLDHNSISIITAGIFYMDKLNYLWIRNNGLQVTSQLAFPASLKDIHLEHNKLTTLETTLLPSLHSLYLINNSLSSIPSSWRDALPALRKLHLGDNAFTELRKSDLAAVPNCVELDLTGNRIQSVHVSPNATTLPKKLWLRRAPLRCDCRLHAFATLFKHNKADTSAVCDSPASLKGRKLMHVVSEELVCNMVPCPDTCACVVRPETRRLEVVCGKQLTTEQVTALETLRQQSYRDLTLDTSLSYNLS